MKASLYGVAAAALVLSGCYYPGPYAYYPPVVPAGAANIETIPPNSPDAPRQQYAPQQGGAQVGGPVDDQGYSQGGQPPAQQGQPGQAQQQQPGYAGGQPYYAYPAYPAYPVYPAYGYPAYGYPAYGYGYPGYGYGYPGWGGPSVAFGFSFGGGGGGHHYHH